MSGEVGETPTRSRHCKRSDTADKTDRIDEDSASQETSHPVPNLSGATDAGRTP
jgi:hypothetical protein